MPFKGGPAAHHPHATASRERQSYGTGDVISAVLVRWEHAGQIARQARRELASRGLDRLGGVEGLGAIPRVAETVLQTRHNRSVVTAIQNQPERSTPTQVAKPYQKET